MSGRAGSRRWTESRRNLALYKIVLTRQAAKDYAYLYKSDRSIFIRVRAALHALAEDPHQGKPLRLSLKGHRSYRVGVYRIIYAIEHNILTVTVLDIGHRREAYR